MSTFRKVGADASKAICGLWGRRVHVRAIAVLRKRKRASAGAARAARYQCTSYCDLP